MSKYSRLNGNASEETETENNATAPPNVCIGLYNHFRDSFKSLSTCPKELYINFFLKFCESYGYFSISQILVIYLHNEFGASDVRAGAIYGAWGACITFWGLTISWLNDNFGVRNSLLLGFSISLISTLILATTTSITTICVVLFCFMPMGTAMGIPMLTVGIKRYTNTSNRGFAFGLYYSVMNVAAFVSGPVVDIFNIGFKSGITIFGVHWTGNRLVILTTTCTYLASLVVTYLFLREIRVQQLPVEGEDAVEGIITTSGTAQTGDEAGDIEMHNRAGAGDGDDASRPPVYRDQGTSHTTNILHTHAAVAQQQGRDESRIDTARNAPTVSTPSAASGNNNIAGNPGNPGDAGNLNNVEEYKPVQRGLYSIWGQLLYSPTFWRFSVLTLFLINLNTIFRHLDATLPTYLVRCFGKGYPKGIIYSINPFIIMWLTPVIAALTTKSPHYDMIKYGGYVSAASPFFLAMATETWAVVLFVVFLSLGEAVWSPRVYDYTMSIAPEGREASFSALAAAPLFAAKIPVGLLSGYLVSTYLPEDGSKPDGQTMWLILGLITMTSPLLITIFEPCVREPMKAKRQPASSATSIASTDSNSDMGDDNDGDALSIGSAGLSLSMHTPSLAVQSGASLVDAVVAESPGPQRGDISCGDHHPTSTLVRRVGTVAQYSPLRSTETPMSP